MKIKPIGSKLLIKPILVEKVLASGIIIPDTVTEKPVQAKVISCGSRVHEVKEGDMILYSKFAGTEVEVAGVKYLLINEAEVFAIL